MVEQVGRGGTIRLDARVRDSAGNLVDDATLRVDVIDSTATQLVTDAVPTRDSLGMYHYDYTVPLTGALGIWTDHWTGTVNGAPISGDDVFEVMVAGAISFTTTMLDLAKTAMGIASSDTSRDDEISLAITDALEVIKRKYRIPYNPATPRTQTFHERRYDALLTLADPFVTSISQIEVFPSRDSTGSILTSNDYAVMESGAIYLRRQPVSVIPQPPWEKVPGFSPSLNTPIYARVEVTYTPIGTIDSPVMRAVALTAANILNSGSLDISGYEWEKIGDYSYRRGSRSGVTSSMIPDVAAGLLSTYRVPLIEVV